MQYHHGWCFPEKWHSGQDGVRGRLEIEDNVPRRFRDLIGYRGTTIDPLELFISSGLTSINNYTRTKTGIALANVREVPSSARTEIEETIRQMNDCGFVYPVTMGNQVFNLPDNPYRLSIVAYSGLNYIGNCVEQGIVIRNRDRRREHTLLKSGGYQSLTSGNLIIPCC